MWLLGCSLIQLVTQGKGMQNVRIKINEQLHMVVEHGWDSPRDGVFCPVRKLKVYGHFILLIRQLLLLLLLLLCRSCGSGAPPPHPPPHAGELL
jgi:hypothetical protein